MKRILVASALLFGMFQAGAQNKIGYISPDEVIGLMPEAEKANTELQEFQASLAQMGQDKVKELGDMDSLFVKDSAKLTPSMKEIKKGELIKKYQEVQGWNQTAQDMYNQKADQLGKPIREKAMEAIKAVAKENGYAYVLDKTTLIVAPPGDDLLALVKKKLGIVDKPATTTKPNTPKTN